MQLAPIAFLKSLWMLSFAHLEEEDTRPQRASETVMQQQGVTGETHSLVHDSLLKYRALLNSVILLMEINPQAVKPGDGK